MEEQANQSIPTVQEREINNPNWLIAKKKFATKTTISRMRMSQEHVHVPMLRMTEIQTWNLVESTAAASSKIKKT